MPIESIPGTSSHYGLLCYDEKGRERAEGGGMLSAKLIADAKAEMPTDIFFFSHGWMGDVAAARDQYGRWIKALLDRKDDLAAMGAGFKPMWIGLHWPSLPFGDEEIGGAAFDVAEAPSPAKLVNLYMERLDLGEEARPLIQQAVNAHFADAGAEVLPHDVEGAYRQLADLAGYSAKGPGAAPDEEGAAFDPRQAFDAANDAAMGADFGGGGFLGGILSPLRTLSYWTMKKRARSIGESGMHSFVGELMKAAPAARIHLMGHSFGCIVISSILGGPGAGQALPRAVDSTVLVQGAVSLWAFADTIPKGSGGAGYFNPFLKRNAVRGPIVVTRSRFDRAVGLMYPLASAAVLASPDFGVEEDLPKYGGIGSFGVRGLDGLVSLDMLDEKTDYHFEAGKIYNIESSKYIAKGGGASGAHSDIDGPQVAHAILQAARG